MARGRQAEGRKRRKAAPAARGRARPARAPHPVGLLVREARQRLGLTQQELAERSGLHKVYLAQLEAGSKQRPYWDTVASLARALDGDFLSAVTSLLR